ncbi:MAG: GNAT family N-acetyltransferase [Chitinophagaceae bacterium]|nr:GNAT family N-acetyltransferase [Chitinophagaceae bacterium]
MLRLETFDKDSYEELISWIGSEEELMQFAGPAFTFPLTKEQLETSVNDKNRFSFKVVNSITNVTIGHAEIYLTDHSAYLGRIIIGDKEQRGKGLGQQIVNLLLDFVFSTFDKTKVELNVFDWNVGAIKCYEKVGFVINPNKKIERQIKNEIWTAINMTIDKSRWQRLQLD